MPIKTEEREVVHRFFQPAGFVCDYCGTEYDEHNTVEEQEKLHWRNECGYGSVFGDMVNVELVLCQHCVFKLFKNHVTINDE